MANFRTDAVTFNTTAGNKTVAITPAVGERIFAIAANTGTATDPTVTDDRGGTYTRIIGATKATDADEMHFYVRDQPCQLAVSHTLTMNVGGAGTGGGIWAACIPGMDKHGANAIRQSAAQSEQASGTPSLSFTLPILDTNLVIYAIFNAGAAGSVATEPANFVERRDVGYTVPAGGLEVATRNSGQTGTTITGGSSSATAFCAIAIELDCATVTAIQSGRDHYPGTPQELTRRRPAMPAQDSGLVTFPGVIETIDNSATSSQSLTDEATIEGNTQSGNATLALLVEAIREPNKDNQGTGSQSLGLDATADTDSSTGSGSQTITNEATAEGENNSGSSTLALTAEVTVEPNKNNQGTATTSLGLDATADTDSSSATDTQTLSDQSGDTVNNSGSSTNALTAEATSETDSNSETATPNLSVEATSETDNTSATSSQSLALDATAETTNTSATSAQTIAEAQPGETLDSGGTGTISFSEATAESVTNSATAIPNLTSSEVGSEGSSGTGSQSLADATAETITNVMGVAAYGGGPYGGGPYGEGIPDNQRILEAIAETISNSATATIAIDETISVAGDFLTNTGTATIRINEAEAGSEGGSGSGSPTLSEAIAETVSNSATASIFISDFQTEEERNTGTGAPTIVEITSEAVSNVGTASFVLTDTLPEPPPMVNVGSGSQFLQEAIAESVTNSGTSTQVLEEGETLENLANGTPGISEAIAEAVVNVAASSQTLVESVSEADSNSGTGTPTITVADLDALSTSGSALATTAEALAEFEDVAALASLFIDDLTTMTVVPIGDISTGTWTVAPLYEKVDELVVASGYPAETIRSATNPSNDTAILQLAPSSDPGVDTNHYINVQFWKDGSETLDFILKLKEGNTVIATRTFTNVTETQSNPRKEKIALTTLEAGAIVDRSNLNVELIANQTS